MKILFLSRKAQADLYKACNTLVERAVEAADELAPCRDRDEMIEEAREYRALADRIGYPSRKR